MSMQTRVTTVSFCGDYSCEKVDDRINDTIAEWEEDGWSLRGTPSSCGENPERGFMLTFERETPATDDSEGKESEPVPPMITEERFYELMNKGRADSK